MKLPPHLIQRQTLGGFLAAALLLVLVSATGAFALQGWEESANWVTHTYRVIVEIEALARSFEQTETARRGFLATGDETFLSERQVAVGGLREHFDALASLVPDNPAQAQRLQQLREAVAQHTSEGDKLIELARSQGLEVARRTFLTSGPLDAERDLETRLTEMSQVEYSLLGARNRADTRYESLVVGAFAALLLVMAAVLGWLFVRLRRDLSDRFAQEASLQQANTALKAANRELESFSYSVSHDLRSPLRAIDGYAQMLDEDYSAQLGEEGRRYIRIVREGSQRMAALIDDLLAFSQLNRKSLSRRTVDMTALARQAAEEAVAECTGAVPSVRIDELPAASGDPAMLQQVWMNLVSNAIKYSAKSQAPAVHISGARDDAQLRYEVKDNGVGFDMKYADKLFGVFQRLHATGEYPGTGVGLAIVQRIVLRHGGTVSAHGVRGEGATFGFTLPVEVER